MTDEISKAMSRLDDTLDAEVEGSYADYQAETFKLCKSIAKHAQDMVLKSSSSPGQLSENSRELTTTYSNLVHSVRCALATIDSHEIATRLKKSCYDLGEACKEVIHSGSSVQGNPDDAPSKRQLADRAKTATEKVCVVILSYTSSLRM